MNAQGGADDDGNGANEAVLFKVTRVGIKYEPSPTLGIEYRDASDNERAEEDMDALLLKEIPVPIDGPDTDAKKTVRALCEQEPKLLNAQTMSLPQVRKLVAMLIERSSQTDGDRNDGADFGASVGSGTGEDSGENKEEPIGGSLGLAIKDRASLGLGGNNSDTNSPTKSEKDGDADEDGEDSGLMATSLRSRIDGHEKQEESPSTSPKRDALSSTTSAASTRMGGSLFSSGASATTGGIGGSLGGGGGGVGRNSLLGSLPPVRGLGSTLQDDHEASQEEEHSFGKMPGVDDDGDDGNVDGSDGGVAASNQDQPASPEQHQGQEEEEAGRRLAESGDLERSSRYEDGADNSRRRTAAASDDDNDDDDYEDDDDEDDEDKDLAAFAMEGEDVDADEVEDDYEFDEFEEVEDAETSAYMDF